MIGRANKKCAQRKYKYWPSWHCLSLLVCGSSTYEPCLLFWQLLIKTMTQIHKWCLRNIPAATPWPAWCPFCFSAKISEHKKHKYTFACGCFVVGLPPSLLTARSNDPQPNYFLGRGRNWNKTQMKTKPTFIMLRLVLIIDLTLDSSHVFRSARTTYSAG